ncbi:MAG: hypothetical protein NVS3B14_05340 [Ktedonobacteraceae bacterium]
MHKKKSKRITYVISTGLLVLSIISGSLLLLHRYKSGVGGPAPRGKLTPEPTFSTTPSLVVPTQAIFYDTFIDNSHNWELSDLDGYIRVLSDGMLILADLNPQTTLVESLPNDILYDNFSITVDFTIAKGDANDSTGLYLRGDNNLDHDYRVDINGNNTFDIAKEYLDTNDVPQTTMLVGPQSSSALRPLGQENTLTVIMKGTQIVVLINQEVVSSVTDSDYAKGQIALFARHGSTSNGVVVSFSLVEIEDAPVQLP